MKKITDIVPILTPTGDFMKIVDTHPANFNNKVHTLLNLLNYSAGRSMFFPEMGDYTTLNRIPFNEIEIIVGELQARIHKYLDFHVDVEYNKVGENQEFIELIMTIAGLPGIISVNIQDEGGFVKLLNPKYIQK